jgi:rare lipoprotein A
MNRWYFNMIAACIALASALSAPSTVRGADIPGKDAAPQHERSSSLLTTLEELVRKSSLFESVEGVASYYAHRLEGHRTTSGHRYNPDKLTAAHVSLPLGTVVRVVNPVNNREVHVTINDRCASKSFHFIDLSRAAAKKIGLWGKGQIKVVIIPVLEDRLEEPV